MQYIIEVVDGSPSGYPLQVDNAISTGIITLTTQNKHVLTSDLVDSGYDLFIYNEPQRNDDPLKEYVEVTPDYRNQDGEWVQKFVLQDKTFETEEDRQLAVLDKLDGLEESVRQERSDLLSETDYLALQDVTMSPEMTTYRQALRDITSQSGFPDNITWPVKPD